MLFVYPAIFHQEEENSIWVEFPDLEGCNTFGESINNTIQNAQEALSGYLLTLIEMGETAPTPSDINSHKVTDGFISLVSCDIDPYKNTKAIKKTLTIPQWLNEESMALGVNFSQVLQEALMQKIQSK